ncbi:unnamed protein product [Camellia sinensis]
MEVAAMAFFSKAGNVLKQTVNKRINSEIFGSNPSIFQMIRCMSSSKLFVGGIAYSADDTSLREAFNKYGEVIEARVIVDRETGRSRGFGFVTYTSGEEASAAIQALDGQELHGRRVRVNFANDRPPRSGGFGGGGYGGGGYGGGGGGYGGGGGGYGGGGYGSGDSYGGGGSYGNYGSGGGYGGNNYGSGGSNFAQGGTYAGGTGTDSGSSGNYSSQSLGVAGGGGGSDNYVSGVGSDGGVNSDFGSSGFEGRDQFGSNESNNMADASEDLDEDDPIEGNYGNDDEPDDYANKRA